MLLGSSRVFGARIPRMNRKDAADSLEKIGFRFMAGSALFVPGNSLLMEWLARYGVGLIWFP